MVLSFAYYSFMLYIYYYDFAYVLINNTNLLYSFCENSIELTEFLHLRFFNDLTVKSSQYNISSAYGKVICTLIFELANMFRNLLNPTHTRPTTDRKRNITK